MHTLLHHHQIFCCLSHVEGNSIQTVREWKKKKRMNSRRVYVVIHHVCVINLFRYITVVEVAFLFCFAMASNMNAVAR